jgi:hypothetical protein
MNLRPPLIIPILTLGLCWISAIVRSARADGLPAPDCVEVVVIAKDQVRISWKPVVGAVYYRVNRIDGDLTFDHTPNPPNQDPVVFKNVKDTNFTKGLTAGQQYRYKISTLDARGDTLPDIASSKVVTAQMPADKHFVLGEDFSGGLPPRADSPRFDGSWSIVGEALRELQGIDAARIRKFLFVTGTVDLATVPSYRVMAKIRIDEAGDKTPAFVGLGLGTDAKSGNGYGFVFYSKGKVAFINDPVGSAGSPLMQGAAAPFTVVPKTLPIHGQIFDCPWKVGEEYWVAIERVGDELKASVWPVCKDESLGWNFVESTKVLSKPITDKDGKAVPPDPTTKQPETTDRPTGYPALIGGFEAGVKATFDDVSVITPPAATPLAATVKPTTATPEAAPNDTAMNPFANRSKDSFTRSVWVWALRPGYDQETDSDEDPFEALAGPPPRLPATPFEKAVVAVCPSLAPPVDPRLARLRFDCAATFPLKEFGTCGEVYEEDGAIIHEGMRIVANERGDYLVRFNVSTPAMPVTLRLQLRMNPPGAGRRIALTLPAIEVWPLGSSPEFYKPAVYGVSVVGHSAAIAEHFQKIRKISPAQCGDWEILSRGGFARFGVSELSSGRSYRE